MYFSERYIDALRFSFSEVAEELENTYHYTLIHLDTKKLSVEEIVDFYAP